MVTMSRQSMVLLIALVTMAVAPSSPSAVLAQSSPPALKVPAGTTVNVRLVQDIDVDLAQAGMTFKGRVDDPVAVGSHIAIPREASAVIQAVKVQQAGGFKGSDQISLKMNTVTFGGRVYQVATEYATAQGKGEGKRTARKVGGGAGLGAIVGGVAGGGEGALVGAVVGGLAGTAVAASGTEHLRLPAETRLQFKLTLDVLVQP
jgi:hypothetical protein